MGNLFNRLQEATFGIADKVFGDDITWDPTGGGETQSCRCLFKDPNKDRKFVAVGGPEYQPLQPEMEYYVGDLTGLYESVRNGNNEAVIINEVEYYVKQVDKDYDGKTYRAKLEIIP